MIESEKVYETLIATSTLVVNEIFSSFMLETAIIQSWVSLESPSPITETKRAEKSKSRHIYASSHTRYVEQVNINHLYFHFPAIWIIINH